MPHPTALQGGRTALLHMRELSKLQEEVLSSSRDRWVNISQSGVSDLSEALLQTGTFYAAERGFLDDDLHSLKSSFSLQRLMRSQNHQYRPSFLLEMIKKKHVRTSTFALIDT